ncbi:MAG TPA: ferredoxin [Spirochaetaceae bacterium]|nr:ferredoxin [Spirochaetaceae bacterium]
MKRWHYLKNGSSLNLNVERCVGCGACVEVCPHGAIAIQGGKAFIADRLACMECGACSLNCPAGALSVTPGVGCAAAIITGKLRGGSPDCSCGEGCC